MPSWPTSRRRELATTGVTLVGNTLIFDSNFNGSAGFNFTLPSQTTAWSRATRATAWRCPRRPPMHGATVTVDPGTASVTTTIIDNGTQAFSLTQNSATVNEGSADSYTVHLPTRSIPASPSASTSPSPCRAGSAAPRRRISPTPSWPTSDGGDMQRRQGVTLVGNTLIFDYNFNASAGFNFTLPSQSRHPVRGQRELQPGAVRADHQCDRRQVACPANASVITTIIDSDTQTFSLTQDSATVNEGSADSYTVHLSNPIDPGVTASVNIAITLPSGLGGAEAADFTNAFLADIRRRRISDDRASPWSATR